jgi:hypothetical protein
VLGRGGGAAGGRRTGGPRWRLARLLTGRRGWLGGTEGRGDEHPRVPERVLVGLIGEKRR